MTAAKEPKPAIRRINCGANGHRYTVDGRKADGVTTLIKNGRPNSALINWSARETAEYVADNMDIVNALAETGRDPLIGALSKIHVSVLQKAAARGTALHKVAEGLAKDEEVEYGDDIAGMAEAYVQFLDEWKVRPILVESTVASRTWGYAGTLDLVGEAVTFGDILVADYPWLDDDIPAGTRMVVVFDPKTGRSGVWPDAAYQLSAYRYAEVYLDADGSEIPMASLGIQLGAVVHVRNDGYSVHPMNAGPDTFKTFTHIATTARRLANDSELVGKPVQPKETP